MGSTQRVTEGKFNGKRSWHTNFFRPIGHHGDKYRRKIRSFQCARQHGHINGTVGSGGCKQHAVYALLMEQISYLGCVLFFPRGGVRREALVSHK